jgi:glucuronoarabinoxylan endo-1,4-beta-xylanase
MAMAMGSVAVAVAVDRWALVLGVSLVCGCGSGGGAPDAGSGDAADAGDGPGAPVADVTVAVDTTVTHQAMVGFGASLVYYADFISGRQVANDDIYDVLFNQLGLDVLRVGNWYQNQTETGTSTSTPFSDTAIPIIVQGATAALGHPPRILMSSWTPPAYLKSNRDTKNGGTLAAPGAAGTGYDYAGFAQWWVSALSAYGAMGVAPDYVSIQNEPEFMTNYESCLFDAAAGGANAVYGSAVDEVYAAIATSGLAKKPALVGPETIGLGPAAASGHTLDDYVAAVDTRTLGAIAHHLYAGGSADDSPDSYIPAMTDEAGLSLTTGKLLFMTEFSPPTPTLLDTAWLIHNALTVEGVSLYLYWALAWAPGSPVNWLVTVENPQAAFTTPKGYTVNDPYYALKHYAKWIDEGWVRVDATSLVSTVKASAFLSPGGADLTVVLLNTDVADHVVAVAPGSFAVNTAAAYRSSGTDERVAPTQIAAGNVVTLPAGSILTMTLGH